MKEGFIPGHRYVSSLNLQFLNSKHPSAHFTPRPQKICQKLALPQIPNRMSGKFDYSSHLNQSSMFGNESNRSMFKSKINQDSRMKIKNKTESKKININQQITENTIKMYQRKINKITSESKKVHQEILELCTKDNIQNLHRNQLKIVDNGPGRILKQFEFISIRNPKRTGSKKSTKKKTTRKPQKDITKQMEQVKQYMNNSNFVKSFDLFLKKRNQRQPSFLSRLQL